MTEKMARMGRGYMEVTPELLALLKQLLDICAQEAQRAKEAEHLHEQMQEIIRQIHRVMENTP